MVMFALSKSVTMVELEGGEEGRGERAGRGGDRNPC